MTCQIFHFMDPREKLREVLQLQNRKEGSMIFAQAGRMVSIIFVMSLVVFGCATNAVQKEVIATKKAPDPQNS